MTSHISIKTENKRSRDLAKLFPPGSGVSPLPLRGIPPCGRKLAPHPNQENTHQKEEIITCYLPQFTNQPNREV